MRHKGICKIWFFPKLLAQRTSRYALDDCRLPGNRVAVIGFRKQGRLCDHPARPGSLQYDGPAILTEPNEMRFAFKYQVEASDGLSEVKKMLPGIECMSGAG